MKIEHMRSIDYWVGRPVCFILTFFDILFKKNPKDRKSSYKKILFVKPSELGGIILAYPLLKRIRNQYPQSELFFVTFEKNREIFESLGGIIQKNNIFTIKEDSFFHFFVSTLETIVKIRKEKFDIVFDLEFFARFTAALTALSGAPKKIGFYPFFQKGLYRGDFFTHRVPYNPLQHLSKTYLSMASDIERAQKSGPELNEKISDEDIVLPKVHSQEKIKKSIADRLCSNGIDATKRIVLLNPGEGVLPLREWPLDCFLKVAKDLLSDPQLYFVLIGTERTSLKARQLVEGLGYGRCVNFTGQTSIPELMELFLLSDLLISNDCGLSHLASLTALKKIVIFGPESPKVFGPLGAGDGIVYAGLPCSPCLSAFNHRNSSCRDNKCLQAIRPEAVIQLARKMLYPAIQEQYSLDVGQGAL